MLKDIVLVRVFVLERAGMTADAVRILATVGR
jgi:hypothetical protein